MGMESYNITLLGEGVEIIKEEEYWNLCGFTKMHMRDIENELKKICVNVSEKEYLYNQCISIILYEDKTFFRGFEINGCLSYLEGGIKSCYEFYEFWKNKIPLNVFILNKKVCIKNTNDLYEEICRLYAEKIEIFKRQYGEIELKVTSGKFYHEIKKRNKWYYKLFSMIKN